MTDSVNHFVPRKLSRLGWLSISLVVMLCDQITKLWVNTRFTLGEVLPICPGFNIRLAHNTGAAFNLLSQASGWQTFFLSALAVLVCLYLLHYLVNSHSKLIAFGLSLIIGGALGNLSDRLKLHYVIDFIDWYYKTWHWPTFNIADSAIVLGVIILLVSIFFHKT